MGRFGVGQSLRRVEDLRFLTGQGQYSDDIRLEGQCHGVVVRSPFAHATITSVDLDDAKAAPGVLGVFTVDDLDADGVGDIPCLVPLRGKGGMKTIMPPRPALARGRVRHGGDAVAFVVAETLQQARDAAELVMIDYDALPTVTETATAAEPGQPQIWDEAPNNTSLVWETGDEAGTKAAFDKAAHVTRLEFVNNRVVVNAMEPRATLGAYDAASGTFTLYTGSQGSHRMLAPLCDQVFNVPQEKMHIVTPDVGGGFGMKIFVYPETVLVLFAARKAWPAGALELRSQRGFPQRHPRPRSRDHRRVGPRRRGAHPRPARHHHRQHGRLPLQLRALHPDRLLRADAERPLQDSRRLCRGHRRCSPTPCRSTPTAAPGGRRRPISSNA
jgi:aerobic carbon-monoxide dehydrogenase large subunit